MMSKKGGIATLVIALIALCLSIANLTVTRTASMPVDDGGGDIQYVMYVGTNDKDTNEPVMSPDEAKSRTKDILIDHFGSYTIQEASGGWKDGDKVYQEYTSWSISVTPRKTKYMPPRTI